MAEEAAKTLEKVLKSLQPYPDMQFLLFSEGWGGLEETLLNHAVDHGHSILLYTLREEMKNTLPENTALKSRPYRIEQPRYNLQGRLYNHAFVFGTVPDEPAAFARKIYTGIANAGGLYLRLPRRDPEAVRVQETILLSANYVASSTIDLDKDTLLLYARKMHGWGS